MSHSNSTDTILGFLRRRSKWCVIVVSAAIFGLLSYKCAIRLIIQHEIASMGGIIRYSSVELTRQGRELKYDRNGTSWDALQVLFRRVSEVELIGPHVNDQTIPALEQLGYVQWIRLDGAAISGNTLTRLCKLDGVESLEINNTTVNDQDLRHLACMRQLQSLGIQHCEISDQGLYYLGDCASLKSIDCRGTRITANGILELKKRKPSVTVRAIAP